MTAIVPPVPADAPAPTRSWKDSGPAQPATITAPTTNNLVFI
jgi:hypothetical protein